MAALVVARSAVVGSLRGAHRPGPQYGPRRGAPGGRIAARLGGGDGEDGEEEEEEEYDPKDDALLSKTQAQAKASQAGCSELPADFMEVAATEGLRKTVLDSYLMNRKFFFLAALMGALPVVRDRIIADERFMFKVGVECAIDAGCATAAELHKRVDVFLSEFELFASDVIVGFVLDFALVTLLASPATLGVVPTLVRRTASLTGVGGGVQKWIARLPANVFAKNVPGAKYTLTDRAGCLFYKTFEYGAVGTACGFLGQAIANSALILRRQFDGDHDDDDIVMPPLLRTALVWGVHTGTSCNVRYQCVVGLERFAEGLPLMRNIPFALPLFTLVVRFTNNLIGGEQFVDLSNWAEV